MEFREVSEVILILLIACTHAWLIQATHQWNFGASSETTSFLYQRGYTCIPTVLFLVLDMHFQFAHGLIKTGPNTFFSRIGRNMITNTAVLPGAAWSLKKLAGGTPVGGMHLLSKQTKLPLNENRMQCSLIIITNWSFAYMWVWVWGYGTCRFFPLMHGSHHANSCILHHHMQVLLAPALGTVLKSARSLLPF